MMIIIIIIIIITAITHRKPCGSIDNYRTHRKFAIANPVVPLITTVPPRFITASIPQAPNR
eukprot:677587-Amphidinium_carterae.1